MVSLEACWVWSIDNSDLFVLRDFFDGGFSGSVENWRVLDNWLLSLWLLEFFLPSALAPFAFLLSSDLLQFHLFILEASDEVEVSAEVSNGKDFSQNTAEKTKSLETVMLSVVAVVTFLLKGFSLGLDSWSSIESLWLIINHWWSFTSLVVATAVVLSSLVLSTVVSATSSVSLSLQVLHPLSEEGVSWTFFLLNIFIHGWEWSASKDGWWKCTGILNSVASWSDSGGIAP